MLTGGMVPHLLGITDASLTIAMMLGGAFPLRVCWITTTRMYDCSRHCGRLSMRISVITRVALSAAHERGAPESRARQWGGGGAA